MQEMVGQGIPPGSILIIAPQRSLAEPYRKAIESSVFPSGSPPSIMTISGLSQRMIDLFWPIVSGSAGFNSSPGPPKYLTLETAQYFMARIVNPMITAGAFENLIIDPNRLFSQILDNLNKAAVVGFPFQTIAERLKSAWMGDPGQMYTFDQTQLAVNEFRAFCLENNFLDFSLQIEVFSKHLWSSSLVKKYLQSMYHHLIFENIEEDVPVTHDLIGEWLPNFDSSLLIFDDRGGFRTFLGADPHSGYRLKKLCLNNFEFRQNFTLSKQMSTLEKALTGIISKKPIFALDLGIKDVFEIHNHRFSSDMVNGVCGEINHLIHDEQVPPADIVVLSPFLSDALRFTLQNKLNAFGIPVYSIRPSRSLGSEPSTRCLLTFSKIAHPQWEMKPSIFDLRSAFLQTIAENDLNRADLLARIVTPTQKNQGVIGSFKNINPGMQTRITYSIGDRYDLFREWLQNYLSNDPLELDVFLSRLFGEVLSQKGFGFHQDFDAARLSSQLIVSVQKFRRLVKDNMTLEEYPFGKEYIRMVESGVLAAQFFSPIDHDHNEAVLLAPAYTYLMSNRPVKYQFWLGTGSLSWWERLYQPLTQPYILSREWIQGKKWLDSDEYEANQNSMGRLVSGLIRRCNLKLYFENVGLNESGIEERGPLLQSLQILLKRFSSIEGKNV